MGLLNKIYGLVQAGRCLLNIFCNDKFEKVNRVPASSGVPTLSKADESQTPEKKKEILKFLYRAAVGALM